MKEEKIHDLNLQCTPHNLVIVITSVDDDLVEVDPYACSLQIMIINPDSKKEYKMDRDLGTKAKIKTLMIYQIQSLKN